MRRSQRVLIVEDEIMIALAAEVFLAEHGHVALHAPGVAKALEIAREERGLDLALVDLQLGDGSGSDLIAELRRIRPGLPVIVSTGFALRAAERDQLAAGTVLLKKPWSEAELLAAVEEAAHGKARPALA